MRKITLFVEDFGHEAFLTALLYRLASEYGIAVAVRAYSVRGGHGRVIAELRQYIRDVQRGLQDPLDVLIVCTDGNCKGYTERKQEIDHIVVGSLQGVVLYAIPDPHLERWLLLDSAAFKAVLGRGCPAPDQKCERDRYKQLLRQAILAAGLTPLLGGIEHVEALVQAMNLQYLEQADDSLGRLLKALHVQFQEWGRT